MRYKGFSGIGIPGCKYGVLLGRETKIFIWQRPKIKSFFANCRIEKMQQGKFKIL